MDDIGILNYALTLEYLESEFYKRGLADAGLTGEARSVAQELGANEDEHVTALTATINDLGGTPVKAPKVKFPFTNQQSFLELAQAIEDLGVSAYNGAAPMIESKEVLGAAGSIVQIEARHAARIRLLNKEMPAPDAFEKAMSMDEVLAAAQPFLV
jgi:rubrerythrin